MLYVNKKITFALLLKNRYSHYCPLLKRKIKNNAYPVLNRQVVIVCVENIDTNIIKAVKKLVKFDIETIFNVFEEISKL